MSNYFTECKRCNLLVGSYGLIIRPSRTLGSADLGHVVIFWWNKDYLSSHLDGPFTTTDTSEQILWDDKIVTCVEARGFWPDKSDPQYTNEMILDTKKFIDFFKNYNEDGFQNSLKGYVLVESNFLLSFEKMACKHGVLANPLKDEFASKFCNLYQVEDGRGQSEYLFTLYPDLSANPTHPKAKLLANCVKWAYDCLVSSPCRLKGLHISVSANLRRFEQSLRWSKRSDYTPPVILPDEWQRQEEEEGGTS